MADEIADLIPKAVAPSRVIQRQSGRGPGMGTGWFGASQRSKVVSSVKTWVFRIMMNISRTRGERERRTVPFSSDEEPSATSRRSRPTAFVGPPIHIHVTGPVHQSHGTTSPLSGCCRLKPSIWCKTPSSRLPVNQRTVIRLRDIDGWTSDEVCELLEVSEANQRVLLHKHTRPSPVKHSRTTS